MAQKSGVSEIAAPVPLETGKKKKKGAVCMQMHVSLSSISILYHMLCSYNTISQGSYNIWTQEKPEEIQFKLQGKYCFKSPICGFGGILMKAKRNLFFLAYNFWASRAWRQ